VVWRGGQWFPARLPKSFNFKSPKENEMSNPFREEAVSTDADSLLVAAAIEGDASALEQIVLRHQAWIYNIAFKMIMDHEDARDITQEILIKFITHLASYQPEKAAFRTWLYRMVVNHVLNMKKKKFETRIHDFDAYVSIIEKLPDNRADAQPEAGLLAEELKTGCMMGMLLCLKRSDRMVFLLGAVFGLRDAEGAEIMEMTRENFRQKLSRSRKTVFHYMNGICGHVNPENPCRCANKAKTFADMGMLDAKNLRYHRPDQKKVRDIIDQRRARFEVTYYQPFLNAFRDQPFYDSPDMVRWLRGIMKSDDFKNMFHFTENT
jgi:RNA polymerase sigma factor (sigma-70 family)